MSEVIATGITLEVHRDSDAGEFRVGFVLDGAFIVLARPSIGFVEERIALAKQSSTPPPETTPEPAPPTGPETPPPATA